MTPTQSDRNHELQPLLIPAAVAHTEGYVRYEEDGAVRLRHPLLQSVIGVSEKTLAPSQQHPGVFASFMDLSRALSSQANSPTLASGRSLRDEFEAEFERYRQLVGEAEARGVWEPDYGTYVYDHVTDRLFLIAPERWHRVALTTSTGALLRDVDEKLHWAQTRDKLAGAVVGVIGASVGSNVVEALARELRPHSMKVADPDWVELNNLNRLERADLGALTQSRAARSDLRNGFELPRFNKATFAAYLQQRIDPYAEYFVYPEGLDESNLDQFLLGSEWEPRLDLVVEEADDLELKWTVRKRCRALGIPVMMLTDFGHLAILHFQDFARSKDLPLAYECSDSEGEALLERALTTGNRDDAFSFVRAFVGSDCITDEFKAWVDGLGEQPTSSIPQSGATAMVSGGIAGKIAARYLLGYSPPARAIFDIANISVR